MKKLLTGNEAIARGAWEAAVGVAAGYPGTPSTEILENISKSYGSDVYCEWAPNEKVAFEVAAGAALAGARAMTTMKHVGLNVAADPLMTLAYIGVVGGFVAVVADDPGMNSSQNEQDTRRFAKFAKVPVIEPSDSEEAREAMRMAFDISEKYQTPVILRSTTTVSHSRSVVRLEDRIALDRKVSFQKAPPRFVPIPAWARPMRIRLEKRLEDLQEAACVSPLNRIEWNDRRLGIVTSGIAYQYVKEVFPDASILKLGWAFPFPDRLINEFANGVREVLVVEELEDFLEEHIRALGISCEGKTWSEGKLVPKTGELNVDVLTEVRNKLYKAIPPKSVSIPLPDGSEQQEGAPPVLNSDAVRETANAGTCPDLPVIPPRPPVLCPGCPHRGIFFALGRFDVVVTGDIGCYSLGVLPPLNRMDTTLCMGGGISMSHGMTVAGNDKRVVGVVGDSTFFHSGITGLIDIAYNKGKSVIVVLDNRTTAMTGHQDNPGTGRTIMGEETKEISIADIGRAVGIRQIYEVQPRKVNETIAVLKRALASDEPVLIISKTPCPLASHESLGLPLHVNKDKCKRCGLCLKLGCPGIEKDEDGVHVNTLLCASCKLCQQICPAHAFEEGRYEIKEPGSIDPAVVVAEKRAEGTT
ncbi:MAG: indolepyruvate ferredoxin oxidoreductase subunit alpha [Planctomycetia bacterium]|nr:indolepyruvate ferredoxin oxidoreductase subunit alpha [Planctomycetia bacterium]